MKKSLLIAVLISIMTLAGCNNNPAPVVYQQPAQVVQPQVVYGQPGYVQPQTVIVHDNSGANFATGMLMGHMLSGGSSYGRSDTTIVNKTVVNKTVINQPAPVVAPVARQQTYIPPARPTQVAAAPSRPSFTATRSTSSSSGFRRR